MKIRVLMITHNRPTYTRLSLGRLCDTLPEDASITIWDNGSFQETRSVLKKFENHRSIQQIVYSDSNKLLWEPTNWFWRSSGDAEFLAKVDDDCLMPPNWTEILELAHRDIPEAGILGTWRFLDEDFVEDIAKKKIQKFASHQILRNCWVQGSGYLMKKSVVQKLGALRANESFTAYCIRAAASGFLNGWYFPFLYHEHLDDPRSEHSAIRSERAFQGNRPLSAQTFGVKTLEEWTALNKQFAFTVQACSFDPSDWTGWKPRVLKKICRLLGKSYVPRVRPFRTESTGGRSRTSRLARAGHR